MAQFSALAAAEFARLFAEEQQKDNAEYEGELIINQDNTTGVDKTTITFDNYTIVLDFTNATEINLSASHIKEQNNLCYGVKIVHKEKWQIESRRWQSDKSSREFNESFDYNIIALVDVVSRQEQSAMQNIAKVSAEFAFWCFDEFYCEFGGKCS